MVSQLQSPLFTQRVVEAMRTLYPEELADKSWDNVGLLQENIAPTSGDVPHTVLLTNDLSIAVAEEAIREKASVIISYHPFIFRGLKSVTLDDPQQRIILQLAQHNIAVYCPHTAFDAAPGGLNDWLADMLIPHGLYSREHVQPIRTPLPEGVGFDESGYGRFVVLKDPVPLADIVRSYAKGLGGLKHVMVALPKSYSPQTEIETVAICAGSGYDVVKDSQADLIVTGEMSHHNALRMTELGQCVLTVFHSNSERQFLKDKIQGQLQKYLEKNPFTRGTKVIVSEEDKDPFEIWDVDNIPSA
ncbi:protein NIF3 [Diplogelasinospora grovesii]|uniref:Protein NIF3 n=1 Tax=Diplogelasinospora grovesii TaxID=303347 RepID=A0AAN6S6A9_9PEZI|nr:protein NIF3 [Diplogelasinospora grovesii]